MRQIPSFRPMHRLILVTLLSFGFTYPKPVYASFLCGWFSKFLGKSDGKQPAGPSDEDTKPVGELFLAGRSDWELARHWLNVQDEKRAKKLEHSREFVDVYSSGDDQVDIILSIPDWKKLTSSELEEKILDKLTERYYPEKPN